MPFTGYWSLVVPEDSINYVKNPSFEKDLTGWSSYGAGSGTATQSDEWQYSGIYSLKLEKTVASGDWGQQYSVPDYADFAGENATISVKYSVSSGTLIIDVAGTGVSTVSNSVTGNGELNVIIGPLSGGVSSLTVTVYFADASTGVAFVDAIQVEKDNRFSTYFDGDSTGCYWQGVIHNSKSVQTIQNVSGGKIYDLADYQIAVDSSPGMGMPPIELQTQKQALFPGSLLRGYKAKERSVTLNCTIVVEASQNRQDTHLLRKQLIDLTKPDRSGELTPFLLRYSGANLNTPIYLPVVYDSGLEFTPLEGFSEIITLRMISSSVFWKTFKETAFSISEGTSASELRGMLVKKPLDTWNYTNVVGTVDKVLELPTGEVYIGGTFTSANSVANTANLAAWNSESETYSSIGVINGRVLDLVVDSESNIYAVGVFTSADSVSNTQYIAKYDPVSDVWSTVTPSGVANGYIGAITIDSQGNVFVTGDFTTINGVSANRIAKMTPSGTWSALGSGLNGAGACLAVDAFDYIYVGGSFTTANGVTVNYVTRWNGTTFEAFSDGSVGITGTYVSALLIHSDGRLCIGGSFIAAGSVSVSNIAIWNGLQFVSVGVGLDGSVNTFWEDLQGNLWVGGAFSSTADNLITIDSHIAIWNGYIWTPLDLFFSSGSYQCMDILIHSNGYIYIGGGLALTSGTIPAITSISLDSTTKIYPKIQVQRNSGSGSAILKWIENQTNNKKILLNYSLQEGEILTLDFTLGQKSIRSSLYGSIWNAILPTSDVGTFCFQPGTNSISVLVHKTGSADISIYAISPEYHWSLDGVAQ